jgi:hypothetical protein
MKTGDEIRFRNNNNEIDVMICTFVENVGEFCRIKKPETGEIFRIHKDRIHLLSESELELTCQKPDHIMEEKIMIKNESFDPWTLASDKAKLWIKSNSFSDTVISETIAIIEPNETKYKSVNTYNGKSNKVMSYSMKNEADLIVKLEKRGYTKLERPLK